MRISGLLQCLSIAGFEIVGVHFSANFAESSMGLKPLVPHFGELFCQELHE